MANKAPDYFQRYMDQKFLNMNEQMKALSETMEEKFETVNKRLDFISNDLKEMKVQKETDHKYLSEQIEENRQSLHDAKLTAETARGTLKWVWVVAGTILGFILTQAKWVIEFFWG